MPQVPKRNFHVPLTQELYSALQEQSEQLSTPATTLAREAIARWIEQRKARMLAEDIMTYAQAVAGSEHDLDEELEQAGNAHLQRAET